MGRVNHALEASWTLLAVCRRHLEGHTSLHEPAKHDQLSSTASTFPFEAEYSIFDWMTIAVELDQGLGRSG